MFIHTNKKSWSVTETKARTGSRDMSYDYVKEITGGWEEKILFQTNLVNAEGSNKEKYDNNNRGRVEHEK